MLEGDNKKKQVSSHFGATLSLRCRTVKDIVQLIIIIVNIDGQPVLT